jgi:hypothetical protein
MEPDETARPDARPDRMATDPARGELRERDHAMLAAGKRVQLPFAIHGRIGTS